MQDLRNNLVAKFMGIVVDKLFDQLLKALPVHYASVGHTRPWTPRHLGHVVHLGKVRFLSSANTGLLKAEKEVAAGATNGGGALTICILNG